MIHEKCPRRNPLYKPEFVTESDGAKRTICKSCGKIKPRFKKRKNRTYFKKEGKFDY